MAIPTGNALSIVFQTSLLQHRSPIPKKCTSQPRISVKNPAKWRMRKMQIRMTSLLSPHSHGHLFSVLAASSAFAQILENRTKWGSYVSAPLIAMGTTMFLSGVQFVPVSAPTYDFVFARVMPMAVSLALLETNLKGAFLDAGTTIKAFFLGSIGTILGTLFSFKLFGHLLGPHGWKIASCFCATYIGGSLNYAATAQALGLTSPSMLAAGMAADNLAMAVYFGIIFSIPDNSDKNSPENDLENEKGLSASHNGNELSVESIILAIAAAAFSCTVGDAISKILPSSFSGLGLGITAIFASFLSSIMAELSGDSKTYSVCLFAGAQKLGSAFMLLFFSALGASAGFKEALSGGYPLLMFIVVIISVHLGIILSLGRWFRFPLRTILIASNANIGGPATAAAMANSKSWKEMVQPAIIVGTMGYVIATVIGYMVGVKLLQFMH